uniref:Uncharacterized protein n=1 Tax=Lotharella vacuolata TaxID=74820 RepID=A0A0H5BL74_9EUKA|nr:hypothetical protein [Lotharella vacuolata]
MKLLKTIMNLIQLVLLKMKILLYVSNKNFYYLNVFNFFFSKNIIIKYTSFRKLLVYLFLNLAIYNAYN